MPPRRVAMLTFSRNACLVSRVSGISTSRFQKRHSSVAAVCATGKRPASPSTAALGVPARRPSKARNDFLCTISQGEADVVVGGGLRGAAAVEWRRRQRVEKHGGRWAVE